HQYAFPKPKSADRNRREAAWTHIRWMTDHVAEWTLKAGQVSASRKAHTDPRVTGDPVLKTLLGQAPNWQVGQPTPKWVAAENLTRPVIESIYTGHQLASTLPILAVPLGLALALNRGALRTVLRGVFFFPFTLSVVTVGLAWLWLLDPVVGPFTYYLRALGMPARSWLADPATAMWAII